MICKVKWHTLNQQQSVEVPHKIDSCPRPCMEQCKQLREICTRESCGSIGTESDGSATVVVVYSQACYFVLQFKCLHLRIFRAIIAYSLSQAAKLHDCRPAAIQRWTSAAQVLRCIRGSRSQRARLGGKDNSPDLDDRGILLSIWLFNNTYHYLEISRNKIVTLRCIYMYWGKFLLFFHTGLVLWFLFGALPCL